MFSRQSIQSLKPTYSLTWHVLLSLDSWCLNLSVLLRLSFCNVPHSISLSLSFFSPCLSYVTFMLTSSKTSMPKTPRSTLGNSTTLSWKKERYVNKKSSRHSAVKFVYHFTSLPLCSVTLFSPPLVLLSMFLLDPLKECWGFFEAVFYLLHRWSAVRQSFFQSEESGLMF